jgi:RNA polymerase sigma-B factor
VEAQEAAASYAASSLDAPIASDDADSASLIELLGDDDSAYDLVAEREAIAMTWRRLPDDERHAVELRFMHNLTQSEIGQRMSCSQMHVSRVLRRALARLEVALAA